MFNFFRCALLVAGVFVRKLACLTFFFSLLASAAATALERSRGYYVAISGSLAPNRGVSDANTSKHALNRLIESIVLGSLRIYFVCAGRAQLDYCAPRAEYPSVRAFALMPGVVRTRLFMDAGAGDSRPFNTVALPAATTLYLTSGRADWLSGRYRRGDPVVRVDFFLFFIYAGPVRYYSANWDVAEVERDWKDAILEQKALVNRLGVPRL